MWTLLIRPTTTQHQGICRGPAGLPGLGDSEADWVKVVTQEAAQLRSPRTGPLPWVACCSISRSLSRQRARRGSEPQRGLPYSCSQGPAGQEQGSRGPLAAGAASSGHSSFGESFGTKD